MNSTKVFNWAIIASLMLATFALVQYSRAHESLSYGVDEAIYTYVGWAWAHGDWPYRDVWDHKGPLVYLATALRTSLLGVEPEWMVVQEFVLGGLGALALAVIGFQLWGRTGATISATLSILVWTQAGPGGGHMSTPGSLIALFTTVAVACALFASKASNSRSMSLWTIAIGFFTGLAFCVKPNALSGLAVGIATLLWIKQNERILYFIRILLLAVAGFVVVPLCIGLTFYVYDAFDDLVDALFRFNSIRGRLMIENTGVLALIMRTAGLLRSKGILDVTTAALIIYGLHFLFARSWAPAGLDIQKTEVVVPIWLACETIIVASNGSYTHHLFPLLPAVALAGAWLIILFLRSAHYSWSLVPAVLIIAPMFLSLFSLPRSASMMPPERRIASELKERLEPDSRELVLPGWSAAQLLALAERHTAFKYIYPMPLYLKEYTSDVRWEQLLRVFQAPQPPKLVIIPVLQKTSTSEKSISQFEWAVSHLDKALVPEVLADITPYPSRYAVKKHLVDNYYLRECKHSFCLLELKSRQ